MIPKPRAKIGDVVICSISQDRSFYEQFSVRSACLAQENMEWEYSTQYYEVMDNINDADIIMNLTTGEDFQSIIE